MSLTKFISSAKFLKGIHSSDFIRRSYSSAKDATDGELKPVEGTTVAKRSFSSVQDCSKDAEKKPITIRTICSAPYAKKRKKPVDRNRVLKVRYTGSDYSDEKNNELILNSKVATRSFSSAQEGTGCQAKSCGKPSDKKDKDDQSHCKLAGGLQVATGGESKKGLVLGVYMDCNKKLELTPAAQEFDAKAGGKLTERLNDVAEQMKLGKAFVVTDVPEYAAVALACVGPQDAGYDELEAMDVAKENIRWGVGAGVRALQRRGCAAVHVAMPAAPAAAAAAAELAAWTYQEFRGSERCPECQVSQLGGDCAEWRRGAVLGRAQNWARRLSDSPANVMTPVDLAQAAIDELCPLGVRVEARGRDWIEAQHMQAFLAVCRGACTEPVFIECAYAGGAGAGAGPAVLLAAKGVTFDSGGLCLKSTDSMVENRGSMAGAAVVLAAIKACAQLKVPINLHAVIPCCENMVSGQCMKVGDVVRALNGMSILIENTDMEGRLVLADALVYGQLACRPQLVIDVATLTHGVALATGGGAFGLFTSSEAAWAAAREAGARTGDRPWRLPLWDYYAKQVTDDPSVDLRNEGRGKASPCLGAAFLKKFVCCDWMHVDITGVGKLAHGAPPYLRARRMTGRPARTLAALLQGIARSCQAPPTDKHAAHT